RPYAALAVSLALFLQRLARAFYPCFPLAVELVAQLAQVLLGLVRERVAAILHLDLLATLPILFGVRLGVAHHLLDLLLVQPAARLDLDLLLAAGRLVPRRDVQDAVRVDVERDLDLRNAARSRRNPGQREPSDRLVVHGHRALALEHVDLDLRLLIRRRREDLALLRRDRRVALDQLGGHATQRLD